MLNSAYIRDAMGILLVYDVTNEQSFKSILWFLLCVTLTKFNIVFDHFFVNKSDIEKWFSIIERFADEDVNKILIGNKCDDIEKKVWFIKSNGSQWNQYFSKILYNVLYF